MDSEWKTEGKYMDLPDARKGEVVVRFPPEASGYLHIGHAKAALLNQYYAEKYEGKLIFRFDDTNPEKENVVFEDVIREDLGLLRVKWDIHSYTSDHFEVMLKMAEKLIKDGKAYVDDTPAEQMKIEREARQESKARSASVAANLALWSEMVQGTDKGKECCLRAKIDMSSNNGCLRDPTIYRCKAEPHPRTGDKYKVYPTYDFACPIVDSVEGVTHTLRTTEYNDRDPQFFWFCDAMGLRKPHIWSYARLNMKHTVMSKRKLTWLVGERYVEGWDDPRLPTVRGVLRRGMTVDGLKQFVIAQGSSKSVVFMDWDKIWAFNRKIIDPIAVRYVGVELRDATLVTIDGGGSPPTELEVACHPKNADLGKRKVKLPTNRLLIDQLDAQSLKKGDTVTFINWGNLSISDVTRHATSGLVTSVTARLNLENKDFKKTAKVTWLPECGLHNARATCVYYEHLVAKAELGKEEDFKRFVSKDTKKEVEMFVDQDLASRVKRGDVIQLQRKGFFIVDSDAERPLRLISIPDGSTDLNIYPVSIQAWKKSLKENVDKLAATASPAVPSAKPTVPVAPPSGGDQVASIDAQIRAQGDKIRDLKAKKAAKAELQPEIDKLLSLKKDFKAATGKDWTPDAPQAAAPKPASNGVATPVQNGNSKSDDISQRIVAQGDKIRDLKSKKAAKAELQPEIDRLLALKAEYKSATGSDWTPPPASAAAATAPRSSAPPAAQSKPNANPPKDQTSAKSAKKGGDKPPAQKPSGSAAAAAAVASDKKQTRLGIEMKKNDNFPDWYTEVITKAEMIEYYDVSGCYVLRPWSYSIWEAIQAFFDSRIKESGVRNCYFPMFVSHAALEREKAHIADFAPEVAWVTRSGQSELAEPIAIRPTSETVMYPSYARWVQSHRDLPIRLNQWCNVVRWEFKSPTPFLRTREFLWQEGHSAFVGQEEAVAEVHEILEYYAAVYEKLLAIPVIRGRKTEKEKFAGGDFTTTVEGYIPANGRGIQGATSHHLGQNFSKMFNITFESPTTPGEQCFAYQNSWGLSTRTIGVLIMVHGDDKGLVLPPEVSPTQVVIVPCGITAELAGTDKEKDLLAACTSLGSVLKVSGRFRVHVDADKNRSPGWKFNNWEMKGVPLRIELGPKDLERNSFVAVRRDTGEKSSVPLSGAVSSVKSLLDSIQRALYDKAKAEMDAHTTVTEDWSVLQRKLDEKFIIMAPYCGVIECEENIKRDSAREDGGDASGPLMGAKSLCIPFAQPRPLAAGQKCVHPSCGRPALNYTLFGRSY